MGDSLLGSGIKGTANVHANDESLRRGQATTTVKELSKGAARETLTDDIDVLLAIEDGFTVVQH